MLASNNPSAGVYTSEYDNSNQQIVESVSTGVIVGATHRGPVNKRVRVTQPNQLFNRFGKRDPSVSFAVNCAADFLEESTSLYFTRVARNAKYAGTMISTVNNFATAIPMTVGVLDPLNEVQLLPDDIMYLYAENQGKWGDTLYILMYPNTNNPLANSFFFEIYEGELSVPVERYECTTFYFKNGNGQQMFVEDVVNTLSERVRVKFNWSHSAFASVSEPVLINAVVGGPENIATGEKNGQFFGGTNGDAITSGDLIRGWDLYEDVEDVSVDILMNAGYATPEIHLHMDEIAANRLDCIAILDAPSNRVSADSIIDYRRNSLVLNSSSSALYTPHLEQYDQQNGRYYNVPPSGKIGAIFANTDNVAASWFAPAGVKRGIVKGVRALSAYYDLGDRNALTENQINYVRDLADYGPTVWNADTLYALASPMNDIGVRRLLAILHRTARINQLRSVFQPNDSILRSQITADMESILEPIRRGRGLDWYSVVCDESNNPNTFIANGDVVCDVFLDPTRYTKRIHLNAVILKKGGLAYAESIVDKL